jgi:hypothetical protein
MSVCYLHRYEAVLCCYLVILIGKWLHPFVTYLLTLPRNFLCRDGGGFVSPCCQYLVWRASYRGMVVNDLEGSGRGLTEVLTCRDWNKHLQTSINIASVSVEIRTKHLGNTSVKRYRYTNLFGGVRSTEQQLRPLHPYIHWSLSGPLWSFKKPDLLHNVT